MSTFLTLCQEMRSAAGISGSGPTTVVAQTGIHGRIVLAIKEAWLRIQKDPKDWKWMWRDNAALKTILNITDYVLTGVDKIHDGTFTAYKTSLGTSSIFKLIYVDFDEYKKTYGVLQTSKTAQPSVITRLPNGNLRVYPVPDDVYTIDFEYQKTPQILSGNDDVPENPAEFHDLIKYEAMIEFSGFEEAPEIVNMAVNLKQTVYQSMLWSQELQREKFREVRAE